MFWGRSGVGQELWPISKSVSDPLLSIDNALSADGRHLPCDFVQDCTSVYVTKTGSISNSQDGLGSQEPGANMKKNLLDFRETLTSAYHHQSGKEAIPA